MAGAGLRERHVARTRDAIVGAALELFERQGFEATTVDEIAAAADIAPRTFFRYFPTKEAVLFARAADDRARIAAALAARPATEHPFLSLKVVASAFAAEMEKQQWVQPAPWVAATAYRSTGTLGRRSGQPCS